MKRHVCFELTMPNRGSWNGRWGGEDRKHYIIKSFSEKAFEKLQANLIGLWFYRWDDGWCAGIEGTEISGTESGRRKRMKTGFCGYDWMVNSIITYGNIMTDRERRETSHV